MIKMMLFVVLVNSHLRRAYSKDKVSLTEAAAGIRVIRKTQEEPAYSLSTTYDQLTGQNGCMFDIVALRNLTVVNMDVHLLSSVLEKFIEVYTRKDTFVGYENNPTGWEIVACTAVIGSGARKPTSLINGMNYVNVDASMKQSFYVTATTSIYTAYAIGTEIGNIYSENKDMQILEGVGLVYPFGMIFKPRVWNGTVYYKLGHHAGTDSTSSNRQLQGLGTIMEQCMPTEVPSMIPTTFPSVGPSGEPSLTPSIPPTIQPSSTPTTKYPSPSPTRRPSPTPTVSIHPSPFPTSVPTKRPTGKPSGKPTFKPSSSPTLKPTPILSNKPSSRPSLKPSRHPTHLPSKRPSSLPSQSPSITPSVRPSTNPSSQPSLQPSSNPTFYPSSNPFAFPTVSPSTVPSSLPTNKPSNDRTFLPSVSPNVAPSSFPTTAPFSRPSIPPTSAPSESPSERPSLLQSLVPVITPAVSAATFGAAAGAASASAAGASGSAASAASTSSASVSTAAPTQLQYQQPKGYETNLLNRGVKTINNRASRKDTERLKKSIVRTSTILLENPLAAEKTITHCGGISAAASKIVGQTHSDEVEEVSSSSTPSSPEENSVVEPANNVNRTGRHCENIVSTNSMVDSSYEEDSSSSDDGHISTDGYSGDYSSSSYEDHDDLEQQKLVSEDLHCKVLLETQITGVVFDEEDKHFNLIA